MIVLSGAALVLPDRILSPGTLVIDGDRIVEIRADATSSGHAHPLFAFHGHYIVPGSIDVHVHGVEGIDALDAAGARGWIARLQPSDLTSMQSLSSPRSSVPRRTSGSSPSRRSSTARST